MAQWPRSQRGHGPSHSVYPAAALAACLLALLACGPNFVAPTLFAGVADGEAVERYTATFVRQADPNALLSETVDYNKKTGRLTIIHATLSVPPKTLDANTTLATAKDRADLDLLLASVNMASYQNAYGSFSGRGTGADVAMTMTFYTADAGKQVFVGEPDQTDLPAPLAALYRKTLSLQLAAE